MENDMNTEQELSVGSLVYYQSRHRSLKTIITGETATQWKVGNSGQRFRKSDLCLIGADRWEYSSIRLWTKQDEANLIRMREVKRIKALLGEVNYLIAKDMSPEQVKLLEAVLSFDKDRNNH